RFAERFLGEVERSPMDAEQHSAPQILGRLHRLLGSRVNGFHDPRRKVGADGDRREIEGPQTLPRLPESVEITVVPTKVASVIPAEHGPGRPETAARIPRRPLAEMLGGNADEAHSAVLARLP